MNIKLLPKNWALQYLISCLNTATNPAKLRTEHEHRQMRKWAKALEQRMNKMGFRYGVHYVEWPSGRLESMLEPAKSGQITCATKQVSP